MDKAVEEQTQFEFTQEHPVIRDMSEYGCFARVEFQNGETKIIPGYKNLRVHKKEEHE